MSGTQSMETKQSFSTSEVAQYCHVTPDTIRKWAEAGRIRVFKTPGGHRRIRREELTRFLRENNIPIHDDLVDGGTKVLIVDDETGVISVIRRLLEKSNPDLTIREAMDGFEAGRLVGTFHPTVVFLDLKLPGLDGFEVCRRIKSSEDTQDIEIIAMSGFYDDDVAEKILGLGASDFLSKPFTPDDIRKALAKIGIEVA